MTDGSNPKGRNWNPGQPGGLTAAEKVAWVFNSPRRRIKASRHPRTEEDKRREREERDRRTMGCVVAVLWLVLPMTFGFGVAKHGGSFWLGFFIGALANGVFRFLWKPFGLF